MNGDQKFQTIHFSDDINTSIMYSLMPGSVQALELQFNSVNLHFCIVLRYICILFSRSVEHSSNLIVPIFITFNQCQNFYRNI